MTVQISKGQRDQIARSRQWAARDQSRTAARIEDRAGQVSLEREIREYATRLPHRLTAVVETLFEVGGDPKHPKAIEAAKVLLDRLDGPVKVSVEHAFEQAREGIVLHVSGSPQRALPGAGSSSSRQGAQIPGVEDAILPLSSQSSVLPSKGLSPQPAAQTTSRPSLAHNAVQRAVGHERAGEGREGRDEGEAAEE